MVTHWFKGEARRVYGVLAEETEERDSRQLVELIQRRKGGSVTVRELQQASHQFKRAGDVESALNALAEAGIGRWEQQGPGAQGGRPTRIFRLNAVAGAHTTPKSDPSAPTKPPMAAPETGCVGVGAVDAGSDKGGDWGTV